MTVMKEKKILQLTCKGIGNHIKEIVRRVARKLEEDFNEYDAEDVMDAITDEAADYVDELNAKEQLTLIGCYGLNKVFKEHYIQFEGGGAEQNLSGALCYRILTDQFMPIIDWSIWFLDKGEIEITEPAE
jgi:hypothetical protein